MFFMSKRAEMGIGTLVLFIAMILVSAIAAGVIIQTATSLQSRALETGRRSTIEVSTAIKTILLYGQDASVNRSIQDFRHHVKLVAGSDPIKFDDMILTLDLHDVVTDYIFSENSSCENATGDEYRIHYVKNATQHVSGYISNGDIVELCYESPRRIYEDEFIRINLIPKTGSVMTLKLTTPGVMVSGRIFLYP